MAGSLAAFGQAVRALRKSKGWRQEDLGWEIGMDRSYVSALERGDHDARYSTICALADALGVSAAYLVRLAAAKEKPKA